MVGKWYGEIKIKNGGKREWTVERSPNGEFVVTFAVTDRFGGVEKDTEYGEWGADGGVYFTITKGWIRNGEKEKADSNDGYFNDAYEILELTEESMTYRSFSTGSKYTVSRLKIDSSNQSSHTTPAIAPR